jgi:hypothetical protein
MDYSSHIALYPPIGGIGKRISIIISSGSIVKDVYFKF